MMRKTLIGGLAGLFTMSACGGSSEAANAETISTFDTAPAALAVPAPDVAPERVIDSARIRDSLQAKARRDSARAKVAHDSAKAVGDRAIANRRRY